MIPLTYEGQPLDSVADSLACTHEHGCLVSGYDTTKMTLSK